MKNLILVFSFLFTLNLCADIAELHSLMTGRFDNNIQTLIERSNNAENPHERIHSVLVPVNIPELSEYVLYTEQYAQNDPEKIFRQRLYAFSNEGKEIKMALYKIKDKDRFKQAYLNPSILEEIKVEDANHINGCDLYFAKEDNTYIGKTRENECSIKLPHLNKPMNVSTTIHVSPKELWIYDEAFTADGKMIWGREDKVPHKLNQARSYKCTSLLKKEDGSGYIRSKSDNMHDQGAKFYINEGERKFSIDLSQVIYGNSLELIKLGLHKGDEIPTMFYIWSDPDSKRIGFNMGWVQAWCNLTSE